MAFPLSEAWFHPPSRESGGPVWQRLPESEQDTPSNVLPLAAEDHALVRAVAEGDHTAFRVVYEAHLDLLLRFAYGYTRSAAVSQDIVADVFIALWMRRVAWNPLYGIRAYLLAAVRNRAMDEIRHQNVVAHIHDGAAADVANATHGLSVLSPDATLDLEEQRARLRQAIMTLSPDRRRALMLRWQEGLSPVEIAAVMGISRAAVDQLVSRAIKILRTRLATKDL